ncbi:IclR family transcriptional regulator [Egicoccus sp. AB-alg6-2]|uniref:IclR family transcriptional regulator n=1 Tax=Egicoccus sp. AB-alg6-2 TaxID=3242692 RepID=UPI00359DE850
MAARSMGVQSVERALDVLEVLAASGREMGISELGQATQLPYATIHRLTATLVRRGYVRQDPRSRKYVLGARLVELGTAAGRMLGGSARPYLERLVELTGETANLALLEDGYVVYVAQASSRRMVRMFTEVGNRVLPHSTAVGKVLLAHQPRAVAERILQRNGLPPATANTVTDAAVLLRELERVRERDYALDLEEQEEGVNCVAVPLLPANGLVAAMSVSGPTGRLDEPRRREVIEHLRTVAADLVAWMDGGDIVEVPAGVTDEG